MDTWEKKCYISPMKKVMIMLLKPFSFLPAVLLMYLIFTFSAQTGEVSANLSYKVSHKIVSIGNEVMDLGMDEDTVNHYAQRIHPKIRKLAHMAIYFCLAVAVSFPLYVYGLRGIWLLLLAGGVCVGFACLDEYHQSFVAGRGPSSRDVLIDGIGVFLGIMVVRICCWTTIRLLPGGSKKKRGK